MRLFPRLTAADPPILPRQSILPAVFAKESADSRRLNGFDWGDLLTSTDARVGLVPGSRLSGESIAASQLASNSVTETKLADAAVTLRSLASAVRDQLVPPGTINAFGGVNVPQGWMLCDGRAVSGGQYPRLSAAISTNWGGGITGSTNDFNLPDLRGYFLRGVDGATGRDPDWASRTNQATGGSVGDAVGSVQGDSFSAHTHLLSVGHMSDFDDFLAGSSTAAYGILRRYDQSDATQKAFYDPLQTVGGSETRPKNVYVNYIIKY